MMRTFMTQFHAISSETGSLQVYNGPNVEAISLQFAEKFCRDAGMTYLQVVGEMTEVYHLPYEDGRIIKHKVKYN